MRAAFCVLKGNWMKKKIALWAIAIVVIYAFMFIAAPAIPGPNKQVRLRAIAGNSTVQMFDRLSDDPDVKVTTFPNGRGCTKVSDLLKYGNGPTTMYFYKLNCNGTVGYVNADWVR
jgi:hypothetical protein